MNTFKECDNESFEFHCKNSKNALFYDSIPLTLLPDFAKSGGLDTGCDLDLIPNYIAQADSILEVGAGYGRVISNLLRRGYDKKLVAIERSKRFYDLLQQKYDEKLCIINSDIASFDSSSKFDLILWLWSGICDFSHGEQSAMVSKLAGFLSKEGLFVVDSLLPATLPVNAENYHQKYAIIPGCNDSKLYVYTPSPKEITNYAKKAGLNFTKSISYKTTTDRNRMLYLLSRCSFPQS